MSFLLNNAFKNTYPQKNPKLRKNNCRCPAKNEQVTPKTISMNPTSGFLLDIFSAPYSNNGSHKMVCPTIPYSKKLAINSPKPNATPEKSEAKTDNFMDLAKI